MRTDLDRRAFVERTLALMAAPGAPATSAAIGTDLTAPASTAQQSTLRFFPGFKALRVQTSEALINGVIGGNGPPVLLLHGFPQSHLQWRTIARTLAHDYT
ncbi:MAG: alpha/beta fold hydrolase, partial [Steroidobacteraceae bacterium]